MGHGKSRPLRNLSKKKGFSFCQRSSGSLDNHQTKDLLLKGGKCVSGSFCWKSLCVVSFPPYLIDNVYVYSEIYLI